MISSLVLVNTHTCVNERITDMMSAGPFVAGLKCSGNVFGGFSSFAWQRGTLQLIAIHLITLHNILEYMQIAIIQTEAADFVKINICVILKTFGHDCIWRLATNFKVHYHHQLDWSVDLSSSFNHPRGYMLLKTNEEMGEAGLAASQCHK